jgi:hypothetical protein
MPPYCITESELAWVYQQIDLILAEVLDREAYTTGKKEYIESVMQTAGQEWRKSAD